MLSLLDKRPISANSQVVVRSQHYSADWYKKQGSVFKSPDQSFGRKTILSLQDKRPLTLS